MYSYNMRQEHKQQVEDDEGNIILVLHSIQNKTQTRTAKNKKYIYIIDKLSCFLLLHQLLLLL